MADKSTVTMTHPDSPDSIEVQPGQVENAKQCGWLEAPAAAGLAPAGDDEFNNTEGVKKHGKPQRK